MGLEDAGLAGVGCFALWGPANQKNSAMGEQMIRAMRIHQEGLIFLPPANDNNFPHSGE